LNVTESTVTRWIKKRGLPAHQLNGQYRFNRSELLEWATANQIKISQELFDHLGQDDESVPSLADALDAGGVYHGLQDTDKKRALEALVKVLPLPEAADRELLLRLFLAREAAATTAIGRGIALPHVRNPIVLNVFRPMVTLCFLNRPVDFGALDGQPVHVLFSLVCPTMRSHLQLLSRISYALHDDKLSKVLTCHGEREEILQEVRRIESALSAPAGSAGKVTK
jgi:PTS system nitrogen regulatory IIA component